MEVDTVKVNGSTTPSVYFYTRKFLWTEEILCLFKSLDCTLKYPRLEVGQRFMSILSSRTKTCRDSYCELHDNIEGSRGNRLSVT